MLKQPMASWFRPFCVGTRGCCYIVSYRAWELHLLLFLCLFRFWYTLSQEYLLYFDKNVISVCCTTFHFAVENPCFFSTKIIVYLKPWSNGLASSRKLKTWVYLRLRLARPCVHLRWLAITLVEIKFARKSMQVFYRLANQRKSLRKFNLPLLATTCESVWPGLKSNA